MDIDVDDKTWDDWTSTCLVKWTAPKTRLSTPWVSFGTAMIGTAVRRGVAWAVISLIQVPHLAGDWTRTWIGTICQHNRTGCWAMGMKKLVVIRRAST